MQRTDKRTNRNNKNTTTLSPDTQKLVTLLAIAQLVVVVGLLRLTLLLPL